MSLHAVSKFCHQIARALDTSCCDRRGHAGGRMSFFTRTPLSQRCFLVEREPGMSSLCRIQILPVGRRSAAQKLLQPPAPR